MAAGLLTLDRTAALGHRRKPVMRLLSNPSRLRVSLRRAFTLVEVLVAMCIVGVLFVSLYAGITAGFGVMSQTRSKCGPPRS